MRTEELKDGAIVTFPVPGMLMRGVGRVESAMAIVRDAKGVEHQIPIEKLEAAGDTRRIDYWLDRALAAELELARIKAGDTPSIGRTDQAQRRD